MKVRLAVAGGGVAALLALAGCTGATTDAAYCVDGAGMVVDDWHCGGSDPMYWFWLGQFSSSYSPGQTINVTHVHVTRVESNDTAGRQQSGLPGTGTVRQGATVTPPKASSGPAQARSTATAGVPSTAAPAAPASTSKPAAPATTAKPAPATPKATPKPAPRPASTPKPAPASKAGR